MVDLTSTLRYNKYLSKPGNRKKVYAARAVKRIIEKKFKLTQNKEALSDIFNEVKKKFVKSLKKPEKQKFEQEVKIITGLEAYLRSLCEESHTTFPDSCFEEGCLQLGHVLKKDRFIHHSTKASYIQILNRHPVYTQQLVAIILNLGEACMDGFDELATDSTNND